jgi:hypothetical protein
MPWRSTPELRKHISARLFESSPPGVLGRDALDVVGAWQEVYRMQLNSHGMGAATAMGLSGIDMALWNGTARVFAGSGRLWGRTSTFWWMPMRPTAARTSAASCPCLTLFDRLARRAVRTSDHRNYADAARLGRTPLAEGENHYTRFGFHRLIEDGAIRIPQPDCRRPAA